MNQSFIQDGIWYINSGEKGHGIEYCHSNTLGHLPTKCNDSFHNLSEFDQQDVQSLSSSNVKQSAEQHFQFEYQPNSLTEYIGYSVFSVLNDPDVNMCISSNSDNLWASNHKWLSALLIADILESHGNQSCNPHNFHVELKKLHTVLKGQVIYIF